MHTSELISKSVNVAQLVGALSQGADEVKGCKTIHIQSVVGPLSILG